MTWVEVHITTTGALVQTLSDFLIELGAHAVTLQDAGNQPIYEPNPEETVQWPKTTLIGLFEEDQSLEMIAAQLNQENVPFHFKKIPDQDWVRQSLANFKPLFFGNRLWVCPSWCDPPEPNAINVFLDPGLAFGTGAHPTTSLCLNWLSTHITGKEWVIDYGSGSGILGIAALKLGAKQVIAVDKDPQALEATQNNGLLNGYTKPRLAVYFPNNFPRVSCDLLIANILALPLIELASDFASLVKTGGKVLLSGILCTQTEEVKKAYLPYFTLENPVSEADWVHLVGIRK